MTQPRSTGVVIAGWIHRIATAILGLFAVLLAAATAAGAFGILPTLSLALRIGEIEIPDAGLAVQAGLLLLVLSVLAVLPGAFRVLQLERSHRDFAICLSDVAEAYRICHAADRADTFRLPSEYDAVRERIRYLREHPDLAALEPEILELAAQMSFASRDLAEAFSDATVARARGFLRQRQEEIALFEERIARAHETGRELRRTLDALSAAEAGAEARRAELEAEFGDLLRDLGYGRQPAERNVIALDPATAAE